MRVPACKPFLVCFVGVFSITTYAKVQHNLCHVFVVDDSTAVFSSSSYCTKQRQDNEHMHSQADQPSVGRQACRIHEPGAKTFVSQKRGGV